MLAAHLGARGVKVRLAWLRSKHTLAFIVAIAYTLGDASFDTSREAKLMLAMIPRNSVLIHLDSDYEEITKRRGVYSDPPDFVRFQRVMYERLSRRLRAAKIDTTTEPVEETFREILRVAGVARASGGTA